MRHGIELWAAAGPNSSDKYPAAIGQSIIMTEIKGSLDAAFFSFNEPTLTHKVHATMSRNAGLPDYAINGLNQLSTKQSNVLS